MKKYFLIIVIILGISCETDQQYEDLNKDPNNPTSVSSSALFTAATVSLFDQMESTSVNSNIFRMVAQYWTETTYIDEANFNLQNRNIPENFWSELYRDVLYDLKNAKELTDNSTEKAQIEVLEVYTWQILVDTFGDIPYNEALLGQEKAQPAYDSGKAIYSNLISRINGAISELNGTGFSSADLIYKGDISKWKKFAFSIKLKLATRINDTTSANEAAQGVFASNADNAILAYEGDTPNTNPLWESLVQSGRNDFVVANTIVDEMNALEDPRREAYFDDNLTGDYIGGIYGGENNFYNYTHIGDKMHNPTFRGVLMDYAEVRFLLASAEIGSVEDHYKAGITASFEDWGIEGAEAYIAKPEIAFSKNNLGKQFWIAMYNRGHEGWSVYRKFDGAIAFNLPENTKNPIPTRFTYPVNEQTLNEKNYNAASSAIGGDSQTTKIFWDK